MLSPSTSFLQDGHELPPPIAFDVEAPTTLPPCKVRRGAELELVRGGESQLRGPDACLFPGKLFRNGDAEEPGPALPAAVSTARGPRGWGEAAQPPRPLTRRRCRGPLRVSSGELRFPSCVSRRYYAVYDSGDRQRLLDAYHDGACCSLSIPFTPQNPAR